MVKKNFRQIIKKELNKFPDKKLGELENSKELQKLNEEDLFVSYDFTKYPSAQIDLNSTWLRTETAYPFKKSISDAICSLFISGR